jgi:hypothetical protein
MQDTASAVATAPAPPDPSQWENAAGGSAPQSQLPSGLPSGSPTAPSDAPAPGSDEDLLNSTRGATAAPTPATITVLDEDAISPAAATSFLDLALSAEKVPDMPTRRLRVARPDGSLNVIITLVGLDDTDRDGIRDRCFRKSTDREKEMGAQLWTIDMKKVRRLEIAEAAPEVRDPRVLQKWGPTPEHVVGRWFLPGEIEALQEHVMVLSGYGDDAVTLAGKS